MIWQKVAKREWDTDLAVVAPRTSTGIVVFGKELHQPLFHRCFAIASCDTNRWNVACYPPMARKILPRMQGIGSDQDVGIGQIGQRRIFFDDEVPGTHSVSGF